MFCLNLGYTWSIDSSIDLNGAVYSASGVNLPQYFQRDPLSNNCEIKLFDPQLYLISFDAQKMPIPCARLATYPWFPAKVQEYANGNNMRDWFSEVKENIEAKWQSNLPEDFEHIKELIITSIKFQIDINTSKIIIPSPLVKNIDDIDIQMKWIDAGIKVCEDLDIDIPLYATLAISDLCLRNEHPENNDIIEICVDQITSRSEIDGVYFVLERHSPTSRRLSNQKLAESILTLSYLFGRKFGLEFFVNYCGEFGLIALGAGANYFASNDTYKGKRLHFADYIPRGGGSNYPNFFSISCLSDFRAKTDLERIRDEGLLRYLQKDNSTQFSKPLFKALEANANVQTVPDWAETLNNVSTANDHYIKILTKESKKISNLSFEERIQHIRNMLNDAYRNMTFLDEVIEDEPLYENGSHLKVWKNAYDQFLKKNDLI